MIRLLQNLAVVATLGGMIWWICPQADLRHPAGVRMDQEPVQGEMDAMPWAKVRSYDLTAVATYQINARVLHTKRYWADGDDLVPYDVALGWGPMSDQAVLDKLEISQGNRFFFYEWSGSPPIPQREITCHAANNHLIAANSRVASAIKHLRAGQFVQMRGYLVNASRPDGFHWNTSLTRSDDGNGACELFYVEDLTATDEPVKSMVGGG